MNNQLNLLRELKTIQLIALVYERVMGLCIELLLFHELMKTPK